MNHQRKFVKSDFGLSGNITIVLHIFFYSESKARENPRIISGRRIFTFFSIQSKNALCYHFLLRVLLLCFFVNLFLLVVLVYHQAIASGICARLNDGKIACNIILHGVGLRRVSTAVAGQFHTRGEILLTLQEYLYVIPRKLICDAYFCCAGARHYKFIFLLLLFCHCVHHIFRKRAPSSSVSVRIRWKIQV